MSGSVFVVVVALCSGLCAVIVSLAWRRGPGSGVAALVWVVGCFAFGVAAFLLGLGEALCEGEPCPNRSGDTVALVLSVGCLLAATWVALVGKRRD